MYGSGQTSSFLGIYFMPSEVGASNALLLDSFLLLRA